MNASVRVYLLTLVLAASLVQAQDSASDVLDTVERFHRALADESRNEVLKLLSPEVMIFESGGAELSRDEYANHHLGADMDFSAATTRQILDQQVGREGEIAWVLTQSETRGTFRDKEVSLRGVETMLLRQTTDGWRIIHIHWSSRAMKSS